MAEDFFLFVSAVGESTLKPTAGLHMNAGSIYEETFRNVKLLPVAGALASKALGKPLSQSKATRTREWRAGGQKNRFAFI